MERKKRKEGKKDGKCEGKREIRPFDFTTPTCVAQVRTWGGKEKNQSSDFSVSLLPVFPHFSASCRRKLELSVLFGSLSSKFISLPFGSFVLCLSLSLPKSEKI